VLLADWFLNSPKIVIDEFPMIREILTTFSVTQVFEKPNPNYPGN